MTRNGYYYFRIAVPLPLVGALGRREITYSLKTKDYKEAIKRSWRLLTASHDVFNEAYAGAPTSINHLGGCLRSFAGHSQSGFLVPALNVPLEEKSQPISMLFEEYLNECKGDRDKTIAKKRGVKDLWIDINGDTPVREIDKEKARNFKQILMKLPANLKQRYGSVKKVHLEEVPEDQRLSIGSINDKLLRMSAFINWLAKNGYYDAANPFNGLSLKDTESPEEKKNGFTEGELKTFITSPIYTGSVSAKPTQRLTQGRTIIKDSLYWIPLIGLYTGARLQEICQLYVTDIYQTAGVWVIDINKNGEDKRLKTSGSKRKVPIHPKLVELGLIDYCKEQEVNEDKRLFSDVQMSNDGTYSGTFSKKFSRILNSLKIKTDKTSFHSFRHTFVDALKNTDVSREVREALVGHMNDRTAHDNYGSAIGIQRLYEGILKLKYDLDLKETSHHKTS